MKKNILIAFLISLPIIAYAEVQRYKFNDWIVTIDPVNQSTMIHGIESSDKEIKLPQLFIWCSNAWPEKKYKMGLLGYGAIDVEDSNYIEVKLSVDDNPKFTDGWFEEQTILFSPIARVHIKNMLDGNELHVQLRDKHKLHKYTYALAHFDEALQLMSQVCTYQFK